ncbi:MAG: hypothetical protein KIT18_11575 [Burkholderiales bacterium]|nr:hypothetical protein [Burkholderiales bacterium]
MRHVVAAISPDTPDELWVLISDQTLDRQDPGATMAKTHKGQFSSLRLFINARKPNPDIVQGVLLLPRAQAPTGEIVFAARDERLWQKLELRDARIAGELTFKLPTGPGKTSPGEFHLGFDAPVQGKLLVP